jgi:succinoglycan biosynthesis protein ExoM
MQEATHILVAIATFRRPGGLERALASVAAQRVPPGCRMSALVVNNDPADRAPHAIAARVADGTGLAVEVVDEPRPGVAWARNRAATVARESADELAFLDDDETAPPGWIAALHGALATFGADVATGTVRSEFEEEPPAWVRAGRFFERPERPTGTPRPWAFTGSVLMRTAALARLGDDERSWFDPSFAQGEDRDFFTRLARAGARIVWVAEEPPVERVPASRATAAWLVARMGGVGRSTARIERGIRGLRAVPLLLAKSLAWIAIGSAQWMAGLLAGRAARVRGRRSLAYGAGLAAGALASST